MSVTYLQKSSNSNNPNSGKYLISCQEKITIENPTTAEWLHILEELKPTNFKDKNRVLLGVLEKRSNVVIKISDSDRIYHEYYIGDVLKEHHVPGFIEYICKFQCNDDYKKYHPKGNSTSTSTSLCKGPGDDMKVIVMPYYSYGNLKLYKWKPENYHALKTCILQVVLSLLQAYESAHIIHNDIHLQNVLIAPTKRRNITYTIGNQIIDVPTNGLRTIIMDFENAFHVKDKYDQGWISVFNDIKKVFAGIAVEIDTITVKNGFKVLDEFESGANNYNNPLKIYSIVSSLVDGLVIKQKEIPTLIYDPYNIFRK